ncbi:hypothetical protein FDG2_1880 [Candidatus Protofrankia californiensis]|uniref:Uncharacterized protein n=1 Tax=Candidatus Protofrankia californiensis TaxID=1839754 RepID=A0A1C3NWJ8_9ACTN|nr:hypothetical protein FDG2_1880 [Candidatus Protofrankia californiensis]
MTRAATGRLLIGHLVDSGRPVFAPSGSLLICGPVATGKTVLAARLAATAADRGQCWMTDDGGNAYAYTDSVSHLVITAAGAADVLAVAAATAAFRAGLPVTAGTPEPTESLMVVIDSADELVRTDAVTDLCRLAASGPDVGVDLVATASDYRPRALPRKVAESFTNRIDLTDTGVGFITAPDASVGPVRFLLPSRFRPLASTAVRPDERDDSGHATSNDLSPHMATAPVTPPSTPGAV